LGMVCRQGFAQDPGADRAFLHVFLCRFTEGGLGFVGKIVRCTFAVPLVRSALRSGNDLGFVGTDLAGMQPLNVPVLQISGKLGGRPDSRCRFPCPGQSGPRCRVRLMHGQPGRGPRIPRSRPKWAKWAACGQRRPDGSRQNLFGKRRPRPVQFRGIAHVWPSRRCGRDGRAQGQKFPKGAGSR
jgi:hypothetical protein